MGVEGYKDGLKAGKGFAECNTGEVDPYNNGEEAEDNELEVRVTRLESVIKPTTEVVVTGSRVRFTKEGGYLGGNLGIIEKRERRIRVGGGDRKGEIGWKGGENGGERFNGRFGFR